MPETLEMIFPPSPNRVPAKKVMSEKQCLGRTPNATRFINSLMDVGV